MASCINRAPALQFPLFALLLVTSIARAQPTAAPAAAPAPASAQKLATLSGNVVNSVTGEPLRKTDVALSSGVDSAGLQMAMRMFGGGGADPSAAPEPAPKSFKGTTNANGEFHIEGVDPGDYTLKATHAGFVDRYYSPDDAGAAKEGKIHLSASEDVKGIVFHLVPQGAVSGKVVDEDGDPVAGAVVAALAGGRAPGKKMAPVDTTTTNDRGEYRLGKIPPGSYYVNASQLHMDFLAGPAPPPPADGSPETNYVTTYFPGATDAAAATKIDVAAGADLTGFTIRLHKSKVVRVKGQALAADGTPLKGGQVMLMSQSSIGSMQMSPVHGDGTFEIANLQPGSYMLMSIQMNGTQPSIQMQSLVVPAEGISGVKLRAQPEQTIEGKIVIGGDRKIPLKGLMVMLAADEAVPAMPAMGSVLESGAFTLKVSGAAYNLELPGEPEGTYLKSVVWNGREMLGKPLDFSAGGAGELVVTLGVDGGQVDATVTADGDKPAPEATVVLIPTDPARRSKATVKEGEADTKGHATLKDVPPGDYLAFAWKGADTDAWLDSDFLKPLEQSGKRVSLSAGGSEKVDLKQLPPTP